MLTCATDSSPIPTFQPIEPTGLRSRIGSASDGWGSCRSRSRLDAAELLPIPNKGTVVVAVDEAFDLNNKAHIKQANIVEMRLADLDLLPVIGPGLM